jgi:hypothetical protein
VLRDNSPAGQVADLAEQFQNGAGEQLDDAGRSALTGSLARP